jgi:hypothetical protein
MLSRRHPFKKRRVTATGTLAALSLACLLGVGLLLASVSAAPPAPVPTTQRAVGRIARERFDVAAKGYELAVGRYGRGPASQQQVLARVQDKP